MQQMVMKGFEPNAIKRSVVDDPSYTEGLGVHPLILSMAAIADSIPDWSTDPSKRDKALRAFWRTEPLLAGAVFSTVSRNASFKWELVPSDPTKPKPKNTLRAVEDMLRKRSNRGRGWIEYRTQIMEDLCTQDNGAFHELIRMKDVPTSPVVALNHLDSARCFRTGDPYYPVIYTNRFGKQIPLKWWNVYADSLFPSAMEEAYGVQYSPITIALLAAQILRDIAIYKREKVSGGNTRAIHFVTGVSQDVINDAKAWSREQNLNLGFYRYTDPVVIPGLDPQNPVTVATIELASLPDAFNEETTYSWYVVQLANAFGMDYQEFAPLPGGNLGSGQQSEVQHLKAQGKGPALAMGKTEEMLNNNGIIPNTVMFRYKEHDLNAEMKRSEASFVRSKDRTIQINSGILDPEGALDMMVESGDISEYIAQGIKDRGLAMEWYRNRLDQGKMNSAQQVNSGMQTDGSNN